MRVRFVYLYGPDGAGKSTQARLLVDYLRSKSHRAKRVCIRYNHYPMRLLINLLAVIAGEKYRYPSGEYVKVPRALILRKCSSLVVYGQLFNVLGLIFFTSIFSKLGYVIVADRYLLDTYVDLLYLGIAFTGKDLQNFVRDTLFRFLPRTMTFIFLDADYNSLVERYRKRGSTFEPEDYISLQKEIGRLFLQKMGGTRIFTPHSTIYATHNRIVDTLHG